MQSFDFGQLILKFRYPLLILLAGFILIGSGLLVYKSGIFAPTTKVEVLTAGESFKNGPSEITVEVSGAVMKPGVYKVPVGSRVEDLLILSGGFSEGADRAWSEKYLNRAAKVNDGQKIYIPSTSEQSNVLSANKSNGDQSISSSFPSDSNALININSASLNELDALPGIGQVYGQNVIEHRPYSNVGELLSRGVLKKSVFEKIKDLVTVY